MSKTAKQLLEDRAHQLCDYCSDLRFKRHAVVSPASKEADGRWYHHYIDGSGTEMVLCGADELRRLDSKEDDA